MSNADERLVVMLEARISEFEKRMRKAEGTGTRSYQNLRRGSRGATQAMEQDMVRGTNRINQALAGTSAKIGVFAGGLIGGALATRVAAFTTNLRQNVRAIAQVGDEARRAGVGIEAFQQLAYVASQNRIEVDALVDGLKELNLRADEWIVTGGGSAAEAFERLGFTADDLAQRLKKPDDLFLEIIGRMEDMDDAAKIRIADEIFGGTGGERFVQLLTQGEAGIRSTMQAARDAGRVMDEEMINRATDLDQRWTAATDKLSGMFRGLAVVAGESMAGIGMMAGDLIEVIGDLGEAVSNIGGDGTSQAESVRALGEEYQVLKQDAREMAAEMRRAADTAWLLGRAAEAQGLEAYALAIETSIVALDKAQISGEEFGQVLINNAVRARNATDRLSELGGVEFSGLTGRIDTVVQGLVRVMVAAINAKTATDALAAASTEDARGNTGNASNYNPGLQNATGSAPRRITLPPSRPTDIDFGVITSPAAAGGGGGAARESAFAQSMKDLSAELAALQIETRELVAATGSDLPYALEYARKRAELLAAAQAEGREITAALAADIDDLAWSYAEAGHAAEEAADRLQEVQENAGRGAEAIGDIFTSVLDGSKSAKEAVADLLKEIARVQMQKAILSLIGGGGGPMAMLGSMLSLSSGGFTGAGPADQVAGVVHGGEYVFSKKAVDQIGLGQLEAMHRNARGYASGGHVGAPASPAAGGGDLRVHVTVDFDSSGSLYVKQVAQSAVMNAAPSIIKESVKQTHNQMQRSKSFGGRKML